MAVLPLLVAILLGWWLSPPQAVPGRAPAFAVWETGWLDHLQRARLRLRGASPPDDQVLLIGVDEATIAYLDKPALFWLTDFTQLTAALLDAEAACVAFDFIFQSPSQGVSSALENELRTQREDFLVQVARGSVALSYLPDSASLGVHNHKDLEAVAETFGNLCSIGVVVDPDGIHRRLSLWLAAKMGSKVSFETGRLHVDGRPVPLEGGAEPSLRSLYRTPQRKFVSAALLLRKCREGKPLDEARGKICLIAPTATSLGDFRPSIYDALASKRDEGGTLGVEHHLAAAETMHRGLSVSPYPGWLGGLMSGLLCGLMVALGYSAGGWWLLGLTLLLHGLVNLAGFVWADLWLPFWGPVGGGLLGYVSGYQWRYLTVERQRRLTVELFSRMVSPQVVDKVLSDPTQRELGGVQRRVTVLYTDINDFTPMCERHTPAEVIVLLNQYFEEMVHLIFRSEGMLKQFVGDEIMVIYGAPMEQPDHAARAVSTALDMLERLHQMEIEAHGEDGFFDIKVGINTGDVVVGHVGSDKHMEYAAVGDDVNLGARIMGTTKKLGVKILVSEVTKLEAEALLPDAEWISHGIQSFKGKTAQMEVFEVRRRSK
ncbi:adenylate/guanylate cyclase domain-containing protein [bacterium]|nr:adenylate/guanylate cyclase domain-containing protein [bacterium]